MTQKYQDMDSYYPKWWEYILHFLPFIINKRKYKELLFNIHLTSQLTIQRTENVLKQIENQMYILEEDRSNYEPYHDILNRVIKANTLLSDITKFTIETDGKLTLKTYIMCIKILADYDKLNV